MTDWSIGGTRIFVQDLKDDRDKIIARLNPLAGGTTLHIFGYEDRITKVTGFIVGLTDRDTIETMAISQILSYELLTPYGSWGDYFVKHVTFQLVSVICQTLRPDLPEDSPIFRTDLELFKDE